MNLATHPYVMRMACALLAMVLSGCLAHHQGAMPGEPEDATFAPIEDARVRYVDVNKEGKAPVVLVHGFAASLNTWGPDARADPRAPRGAPRARRSDPAGD